MKSKCTKSAYKTEQILVRNLQNYNILVNFNGLKNANANHKRQILLASGFKLYNVFNNIKVHCLLTVNLYSACFASW